MQLLPQMLMAMQKVIFGGLDQMYHLILIWYLRHSRMLPKAVAYCQGKEVKQCLLNHFYMQIGKKKGKQISELLDEDPTLMERRLQWAKRLELTRKNGVKLILYHGQDDDKGVRCMLETVCTIIQLDGQIVESFDS